MPLAISDAKVLDPGGLLNLERIGDLL
jgi:hypothetical protein